MEMETRVERLAEEMAAMRHEFGQAQADLRETLKRVSGPAPRTNGASPKETRSGLGASPDESAVQNTLEPIRSGEASKGGISISKSELDLMLAEAQAKTRSSDAGISGDTKAVLSLERLAEAVKASQSRTSGTSEGDGAMTLSLGELASMLRGAQTAPRTPRNVRTSRSGAVGRLLAQLSSGPRTNGFSQSGTVETPRPKVSNAPGGPSPGEAPPDPEAARPPWARANSPRPQDAKLDVNLVSNLVRWVGNVQRRLGVTAMREILRVYRLTGHLPPALDMMVYQTSLMSVIAEDSGNESSARDDLSSAMLELHGIIYGAGRAPVVPDVDFDHVEAEAWLDAQQIQGEGRAESKAVPQSDELDSSDPPKTADEAVPALQTSQRGGEKSLEWQSPMRRYTEALSEFSAAMLEPASGRRAPASAGRQRSETDGPASRSIRADAAHDIHEPSATAASRSERPALGDVAKTAPARKAYASDLTEEEWDRLEPLVPGVKPGGRPGKYERREILNGILYQVVSGCSWRSLPEDLPPWKIVHHYYRTWRDDGTWRTVFESWAGLREIPESADAARSDVTAGDDSSEGAQGSEAPASMGGG